MAWRRGGRVVACNGNRHMSRHGLEGVHHVGWPANGGPQLDQHKQMKHEESKVEQKTGEAFRVSPWCVRP